MYFELPYQLEQEVLCIVDIKIHVHNVIIMYMHICTFHLSVYGYTNTVLPSNIKGFIKAFIEMIDLQTTLCISGDDSSYNNDHMAWDHVTRVTRACHCE
jgi:hypothetical protein